MPGRPGPDRPRRHREKRPKPRHRRKGDVSIVQYLVQEQGVPQALVAVEMGFTYQGMQRRADLVVYDRQGKPLMMVECKAPEVEVRQDAFDQVARYNKVVQARYLVVTNGLVHYCSVLDHAQHTYRFLDDLPHYEAL